MKNSDAVVTISAIMGFLVVFNLLYVLP